MIETGILNKEWRLNNLYRIIDKSNNSIPFRLNDIQRDVFKAPHRRKLILKARQLGMSTFSVLSMLDDTLFNKNLYSGIVSYSLEHAQHILRRIIGHALDTLPESIKPLAGIVNRSAREISFNNGSFLRVDTTLRGGSCPNVLITEFGKTCARNPQKAEEVVTGTLQAVPINGHVIIESTGEGMDGYFADMCLNASQRGNDNLTDLDYQLFFYAWWQQPEYSMRTPVTVDIELVDYFNKLEKDLGIKINTFQRYWYAAQRQILGEKIKQEYPSTVEEAFLSSSDAYYYAEYVEKAYSENRCLNINIYDPLLPVYISMDIGINDLTVMIFFQLVHGEIRVIDYYEDSNKGVDFYSNFLLQNKQYVYHTIFLPHDAARRDNIIVENAYEREFKRLFAQTNTKFHVLKRNDLNLGISHAKLKFGRCVFNINKTKKLLDHLVKYRKKWSEATGRYLDEPYHDVHSNYADAFRYMATAINHLEATNGLNDSLAKHKAAVESRRKAI